MRCDTPDCHYYGCEISDGHICEYSPHVLGLIAATMPQGKQRWDRHFLKLALQHAAMSKDPNTQVGCVIVGPDREPVSDGFNGFPRKILDSHERYSDRDMKLRLIVHAEMNALMNAVRRGHSTKGTTMYVACTDRNLIWGGPPCTRCAVHVIQAGITEIVAYTKKKQSWWKEDLEFAQRLLHEAGVHVREISP